MNLPPSHPDLTLRETDSGLNPEDTTLREVQGVSGAADVTVREGGGGSSSGHLNLVPRAGGVPCPEIGTERHGRRMRMNEG